MKNKNKETLIITAAALVAVGAALALRVAIGMGALADKPVEKSKKARVQITKLNPIVRLVKDGQTMCSGVVIDKTTVLTAAHCVLVETPFGAIYDGQPIEIRASDNVARGTWARPRSAYARLDRAVLKGDFSDYEPAKYISDVKESVATRVPGLAYISCGYPLGGELYCASMSYIQDDAFFLDVKGVLIPGMSGGPTMLLDGRVIAVNTAVEGNHSIVAPIYNVDMMK